MNSKSKYGDDEMTESFTDNYIFFPLGDVLLPLLHYLKITPNMVTLMSTLSTTTSIYYILNDNFKKFSIFYLLGYFFDCIDGRLARKYNMGSIFGMVFDSVSDIVTNYMLLIGYIYKFYNKKNFGFLVTILIVVSYNLSVSYGINEAKLCYQKNKHDNFYKYKKEQLKDFGKTNLEKIFKNIFLNVHKFSYISYKNSFSKYNEKDITNTLNITKEIGFGNYSIFIVVLVYYTMNYN